MRVHFVGVGGKGVAPAASLAIQAGYQVTGDDLTENHRTRMLRAAGVTIQIGANQLPPGTYSSVVASAAFKGSLHGNDAALPVTERLEFVQQLLSHQGKNVLAVSGTVGKSSAAAITYAALGASAPSCYIGADIDGLLCGAKLASGHWAVTEACEYRDAYLALQPRILILLNIAANHEDYFGSGTRGFSHSLGHLMAASADSLDHVVLSAEAAATLRRHGLAVHGHTVGFSDADWRISVESSSPSGTRFALSHNGLTDKFEVHLHGTHVTYAAAMAVVTARLAGLEDRAVQAGLDNAQLPDRRMSLVHSSDRAVIYDDNARLPLQLDSLLDGLRQRHPHQRVIAVISPWGRLNRRDLTEWAPVAAKADFVYVMPVADASTAHGGAEAPTAATDLADLIETCGGNAQAISGADEISLESDAGSMPLVYVTAGYDSNQTMFAEVRRKLADQSN